jgi:hypothetical protein
LFFFIISACAQRKEIDSQRPKTRNIIRISMFAMARPGQRERKRKRKCSWLIRPPRKQKAEGIMNGKEKGMPFCSPVLTHRDACPRSRQH